MPINGYLGNVISATAPTVSVSGASGIFTLEEQMQAAGTWPIAGLYPITRSVRLRSSASAYFNRTPASASNQKTWTWSGWVKRSNLSSMQTIFGAYNSSTGDILDFGLFTPGSSVPAFWCRRYNAGAGTNSWVMESTSLYRDPSAWYHVVFHLNCTSSPTFRAWINGVELTAWTQNSPPSNSNWEVNGAYPHYLGSLTTGQYFDGYLTEINFIDGQALTPASFGVTDSVTGVWNPIRYSGTYGTNGFYLNFSDNSAATATTIGKDYSGNGNNWTPNNISVTAGTTYDSMVDVPIGYGSDTGVGGELRGNYCTFNPLNKQSNLTLSSANLDTSSPAVGTWRSVVGTVAMTSGKWYWEATAGATGAANHYFVGIAATSFNALTDNVFVGSTTDTWSYYGNGGTKYNNGSGSSYGASYTTNDVIGIAYDAGAGTLTFYKNGVSQGTAFTGLSGAMVAGTSAYNGSGMYHNFGQRAFAYTAPSGFKALCTQNLPTATIDNGANYMAASLYTGTGSSQTVSNTVNSISFQPDLVWVKSISAGTDNKLTDSVRGTTKALVSNSTAVETTDTTGLTAFGSSGFTVGASTTYNNSGATYVGWNWRSGGTAVTNTAGSITSSVSANPTAGFSVLTYTGTIANATVGHGLGVAPQMIIARNRTNVVNWIVYHVSLTSASYYLTLDENNGQTSNSIFWQGVAPTSTVFSLGANSSCNGSTSNVAYCFAPISGYSAFGSYTGNGSTDGPFIFTGMRPRFVMCKRIDTSGNWMIIDSSRSPYNLCVGAVFANVANAQDSTSPYDFVANGYKIRSTTTEANTSSGTYIYMAFAENPFNISRAR